MNGVKLAPLIGLKDSEPVELEPLATLFDTLPPPVQLNELPPPPFVPLIRPMPKRAFNKDPNMKLSKQKELDYSTLNTDHDMNRLWTIYLNQQQDLGVDISDKQAMAKAYQKLGKNELNILRMTELSLLAKKAAQASSGGTKSNKVIGLKQRTHKSINKRQKRKKMIRDELKRQLGTLTTLPESEGFPWKAIVSEKGFRNLKLEGWPENIPLSKRIDDFNPFELDKFEQCIKTGSLKIVTMNYTDEEEGESSSSM
ncbi:hypothetical protein BD770DRAFT_447586 [Pilaira anomala]|nr:hypothetical protein BD770DRAFT_447586 [Pilaira anomala]